jgi:RNA methyltransferase, TrmH family
VIESLTNKHIKKLKGLLTKKSARNEENAFVLENVKGIETVLAASPDMVEAVYIAPGANAPSNMASDMPIFTVESKIINAISTYKSPPGIMAIVSKPVWSLKEVLPSITKAVVLDHVQNPLNMGAIIRNATAFGLDAVFYTQGCVDPFHPESIRGMTGNCFQIPILPCNEGTFETLCNQSTMYTLMPKGNIPLHQIDTPPNWTVILGSEGQGIQSDFITSHKNTFSVRIDLKNNVESLNIAVCSGVIFHHFHKDVPDKAQNAKL